MKKFILIVATVAILGSGGIYSREHREDSLNLSSSSASRAQTSSQTSSGVSSSSSVSYRDGAYTGNLADTPYGPVQIAVVVSGGKISDVNFLQMPGDLGHSREITAAAEPLLKQTTLQAQSTKIDFVSGATSTSYGYEESLQAALNQAQVS